MRILLVFLLLLRGGGLTTVERNAILLSVVVMSGAPDCPARGNVRFSCMNNTQLAQGIERPSYKGMVAGSNPALAY